MASPQIKIPTLLGVGIQIVGLFLGVILVTNQQSLQSKASQSLTPYNIVVSNITSSSASIYWQTDEQATGLVQIGRNGDLDKIFQDDRDMNGSARFNYHFVTITGLNPNTTYNYKLHSQSLTYPQDSFLTFTTAPSAAANDFQSLVGTVIDSGQNPVKEAVVTLDTPGAQPRMTVTKAGGNFILPLNDLRATDLANGFSLGNKTVTATLAVASFDKVSKVTLQLPFDKPALPPVTLGQDLNLISSPPAASPGPVNLDINGDGKTNTVDRSIILNNLGDKPQVPESDLNQDGKVDQKDLGLFDRSL